MRHTEQQVYSRSFEDLVFLVIFWFLINLICEFIIICWIRFGTILGSIRLSYLSVVSELWTCCESHLIYASSYLTFVLWGPIYGLLLDRGSFLGI